MSLLPPGLVLRGARLSLRPPREEDVDALVRVLAEPAVARWWRENPPQSVREALRIAIRHCVAAGHHRFQIDPAVDNAQAIRSSTAIGFRPVGVLRESERWPDGRWGDGLLMDLLARELVDG